MKKKPASLLVVLLEKTHLEIPSFLNGRQVAGNWQKIKIQQSAAGDSQSLLHFTFETVLTRVPPPRDMLQHILREY